MLEILFVTNVLPYLSVIFPLGASRVIVLVVLLVLILVVLLIVVLAVIVVVAVLIVVHNVYLLLWFTSIVSLKLGKLYLIK